MIVLAVDAPDEVVDVLHGGEAVPDQGVPWVGDEPLEDQRVEVGAMDEEAVERAEVDEVREPEPDMLLHGVDAMVYLAHEMRLCEGDIHLAGAQALAQVFRVHAEVGVRVCGTIHLVLELIVGEAVEDALRNVDEAPDPADKELGLLFVCVCV